MDGPVCGRMESDYNTILCMNGGYPGHFDNISTNHLWPLVHNFTFHFLAIEKIMFAVMASKNTTDTMVGPTMSS